MGAVRPLTTEPPEQMVFQGEPVEYLGVRFDPVLDGLEDLLRDMQIMFGETGGVNHPFTTRLARLIRDLRDEAAREFTDPANEPGPEGSSSPAVSGSTGEGSE